MIKFKKKRKFDLSVVAYTYNSSYSGDGDRMPA
jgi:hypothetical protein